MPKRIAILALVLFTMVGAMVWLASIDTEQPQVLVEKPVAVEVSE